MSEDLRYPVGKFEAPAAFDANQRARFLDEVDHTPARMRAAVLGLSEVQLDTPYRPEGWTVRQVVHHVPDSHVNAYTRFRLALTEDEPTIRPYEESIWAELPDARTAPIEMSLQLLERLHQRWMFLLRHLSEEQWARSFNHPVNGLMSLDKALAMYAWHGRHHEAHITRLRQRSGW